MTVFVKTISDIVALVFQVLRFQVLLPSFIFVGLNITFIWPQFQHSLLVRHLQQGDIEISGGFLIALAVLTGAFALNILNTSIIRFFEGYPFLSFRFGKTLQRWNINYVRNSKTKLRNELIETASDSSDTKREKALQRSIIEGELMWRYPRHQSNRILPTRLGNIIASAEAYPEDLFDIDAVSLWPFLMPLLGRSGYASYVENSKSILDFLLNMSTIALVFGGEAICTELLLTDCTDWRALVMSIIAKTVVTFLLAFAFYLLAIEGAVGWGFSIRVAYVLHKEPLRCALGLKEPDNIVQEKKLWKYTSFFLTGRDYGIGRGRKTLAELADEVLEYPPPKKTGLSGS